jgi:hypothetical protein
MRSSAAGRHQHQQRGERGERGERHLPPLHAGPTAQHRLQQRHVLPARVARVVALSRQLESAQREEEEPRSSASGLSATAPRPGSGSVSSRAGSAGSSSSRSFLNGRTQPVPGPPAWWLGTGRESPATGLAGREAKHTPTYRAFSRRAELLLACVDESVQRSSVSTHIQGRTQMIDVATFWDAW